VGPLAIKAMMEHLDQVYQFDIRIRLFDDRPSPQGVVVRAADITEGVVYEHNGVKVTAFDVDHHPRKLAFGYRIDDGGRSVVLSEDTRVSENLIRYAQGTDVLIHEVAVPASLQRAG
jgi:ribonuclease Z